MKSLPKKVMSRQSQSRNALYGLCSLFLLFPSHVAAFDFDGSLKGVTISDPSVANIPPSAIISYKQDGNTVTFDSSTSADPDGKITEYRWDFGDGATAAGMSVSHSYASAGNYPVTLAVVDDKGAIALTQASLSHWADYQLDLTLRSQDDDTIGAIFRYKDSGNYYRFSWDQSRRYRRLVKNVNSTMTVLAEDAAPYTIGATYQLQIRANGSTIEVLINGATIFTVSDSSIAAGTVGLFTWGNAGSYFDNIRVERLNKEILLLEDFSSNTLSRWSIIDEGTNDKPSNWSASTGVAIQSSNIYSYPTDTTEPKYGTYLLYKL